MPIQIETAPPAKKFKQPKVVLPDFFYFFPDLSKGDPQMVGVYCRPDDLGQVIFRFSEKLAFHNGHLRFDVEEGEELEGVIEESLEENSEYPMHLVNEQEVPYSVVSYHIGGLAVYYAHEYH